MSKTDIDMDSLVVEAIDINIPVDAENNNKDHTPKSVAALARSMDKLGQIQPIIIDNENVVIAGHGRIMAAKELGWLKIKAITLPVDAETARKMRIADNLTSNQNYDIDSLTSELRELDLGDELDAYINDERMIDNLKTSLDTIGTMSRDDIVDDLDGAVNDYSDESDELIGDIDEKDVPLKSIFEFGSVKPKEARRLNVFMAMLKGDSNKDAKDAFFAHVEKIIAQG